MSELPPEQRLTAWANDVQLSGRVGYPHYANPGELKRDILAVVALLSTREEELAEALSHRPWVTEAKQMAEELRRLHLFIAAMLVENGGPFRVSRRSLELVPRDAEFAHVDEPDGSAMLSLAEVGQVEHGPPVEDVGGDR